MVGAVGGVAIGAGLALGTIALAFDPNMPAGASAVILFLGATIVSAFLSLAYRLGVWRGGIFLNENTGELGLGLTQNADIWWLPADSVEGVTMTQADVQRSDGLSRTWSVEIARQNDVPISLLETSEQENAQEALDALISVGLWPKKGTNEEHDTTYAEDTRRFGVHSGGALQRSIFLFGVSLAVIGTACFLQLQYYVVFGLFFAPVIGLIGWILLAMTCIKRFGHEELAHRNGVWGHHIAWGRIAWGNREVQATIPKWRLKVHGLRGACLELVGDDGILLMGSGATTRSRLSVQELANLPKQFAAKGPLPSESPSPPPQA
jgi:hypothetical protein